jgi:Fis family transcriptional regulator
MKKKPILDISYMPLRDQMAKSLRRFYQNASGVMPLNNVYALVMSEVELPLLEETMRLTEGNQTRAAEILGISRSTLRQKLMKYRLITRNGFL